MRCLIVDDDAVCREMLKTILSPLGQCDLAFNGQEGIGAFRIALDRGDPYDLVCLDIMMPGCDGHAVLDAIRHIESQRGILGSDGVKVIMTTGIREPRHCLQAFREGCEGYIAKPFVEENLLQQVRALLGELHGQPPATHPPTQQGSKHDFQRAVVPSGRRYLIVDDDRLCRELLKGILSRFGQCDFADSGPSAVAAVCKALGDRRPYDVICLDIMMPGMDGHETLTAIRRLEAEYGVRAGDGTKVIMITALCDSKQCIRAFREGCESFVTKPIRKDELLLRLRQLGFMPAQPSAV